MDACVGSAAASAALDTWCTYRLHADRIGKLGSMEFLLKLVILQ